MYSYKVTIYYLDLINFVKKNSCGITKKLRSARKQALKLSY